MNTVLVSVQVSLLHVVEPSGHSVSNHLLPPPGLVWFSPRAYRVVRRPHPSRNHGVTWASPFPSRLATTTGRIEFVSLRTGRSPPVASHLSSRRRSYLRLQSSNPTPTGTSTPLIQRARRRTRVLCEHHPSLT